MEGEGVIENNRKQEERTDKCVCMSENASAVTQRSIISLLSATSSEAGPQ